MATALLVIDVQQGMFMMEQPFFAEQTVVATINELIERARQSEVSVIFVRHVEDGGPLKEGSPGAELYEGLHRKEGDDIVVKRTPDAFHATRLHDTLQQLNVTKVVIVGLQTEYCVDTTCRRAFSLGYEVTVVSDAHSTWNNTTLTAAQIMAHHNETLRSFAAVQSARELVW